MNTRREKIRFLEEKIHNLEKKLKQKEEGFMNDFVSSGEPLYLTDEDEKIVDANPSLLRLLGEDSQIIGSTGDFLEDEAARLPSPYTGLRLNIVKTCTSMRYRDIFEEAPIGIFQTDSEGKVYDMNPAMLRILKAENKKDLRAYSHLETLYADPAKRKEFIELLQAKGEIENFEYEGKDLKGDSIWLNMNARVSRRLEDGSFIIDGFVTDITEQKEAESALSRSERRYKEYIDNSPVGIFIVDGEGTYIDVNESACNMLGYSSDELIGRSIKEIGSPEIDNIDRFRKLKETGRFENEYRLIHKAGHFIDVEFKAVALSDDNYMALCSDITEKKRSQRAVAQKTKMESIGNLAAGVAHDFNNILSSIMGFSELLKGDIENGDFQVERALSNLENIISGSVRAKEITSKLLGFARKGEYNPVDMDLNAIVSEAAKVAEKQANIYGQTISLDLKTDSFIHADQTQMYQIMQNLIINSLQAGTKGSHVRLATDDLTFEKPSSTLADTIEPGEYVLLRVEDEGKGMDMNTRDRMFEPFYTTKDKGTGMGLAMTYSIVKNHQGHIAVDTFNSEDKHGTTIQIYLPAIKKKEERSIEQKVYRKGSARVLFIDDEEMIRKMAYQALTNKGYDVTTASDTKEGYALYKEKEFDLILTDMVMPGINGMEFCSQIRENDTTTPIYIMSGYQEHEREDPMKPFIDGFIEKPFSLSKLFEIVGSVDKFK
ncbi:MAG: PAS domain S-box protein [Candidatus Woesearchaeota archaeon]